MPSRLRTPHASRARRPALLPGAARPLGLLVLALAACRTSDGERPDDVVWLIRHGQYEEARDEAQRLAAQRPDDERAQSLLRGAEVAYVLDLGRRAVFDGDAETGLDYLRRAWELDPQNPVVLEWIVKTRVQLAEERLDEAVAASATDALDRAEAAYEEALDYLPPDALDERIENLRNLAQYGLIRTLELKNYRETQSRSYFDDGMRGLRELELFRAGHDFLVSTEYDATHERARDRHRDVEAMLADEKLAKARGLEDEGLYHAARNEYRMVLLIQPDNEEARVGLDRMDVEVRAHERLARAEMTLLRGEFEEAEEFLSEAAALTDHQEDAVGRLRATLIEARHQRMYEEARGLERDFRYPEAVEAYGRLLDDAEFYEDAIARRNTLSGFIERAQILYDQALAAETDQAAAQKLREILVFWPEYLDVEERLAELEARLEQPLEEPADPSAEADQPRD